MKRQRVGNENVVIHGPFMDACKYGELDVIKDRFERIPQKLRYKGLHIAVIHNHLDIVKYISSYIDPTLTIMGIDGSSVGQSLYYGRLDIIEFFIHSNFIKPSYALKLLIDLTWNHEPLNVESVKILFKNGLNLKDIDFSYNVQRVKELIAFGKEVKDTNVLEILCSKGYYHYIDCILDNGYNPWKLPYALCVPIYIQDDIADRVKKCKFAIVQFLLIRKRYYKYIERGIFVNIAKLLWINRFTSLWGPLYRFL